MDTYTIDQLSTLMACQIDDLYISGRISDDLYADCQWVWFKSSPRFSEMSYALQQHKPSFAARLLLETILQWRERKNEYVHIYRMHAR